MTDGAGPVCGQAIPPAQEIFVSEVQAELAKSTVKP